MLSRQPRLAKFLGVVAFAATVLLFGVACSKSDSHTERSDEPLQGTHEAPSSSASRESQAITDRIIIAYALWPVLYGNSLNDMVTAYDTIVVGEVTEATDISDELGKLIPIPSAAPDSEPPPPGHPKAESFAVTPEASESRPVMTRYSVRLLTVITGRGLSVGDTIPVAQSGGIKDGVAYEVSESPVIQVGTTYLFFVNKDEELDWYEGAPFGRFRLDAEGKLQPVDEVWANLPAVASLTGLTVDEAAAKNAEAVAEAAAAPQP